MNPPCTQAVILAGGQGTRLRPLTLARPKPVVPLLTRPFVAHQLALLRAHGVDEVVLACAYRPDDVRAALGGVAAELGLRLQYVFEATPLGTGGGLRNAAEGLGGRLASALFVLNGDVLTDLDLSALQRFHQERAAATTIFLTRVPDPRPYGVVETESDGRIRRFVEKPGPLEPLGADTVNAGVYLLEPEVVERIPKGRVQSIERDLFPALVAGGVPCFGWWADAYWRDIGSPGAYRAAHADLLEGRARLSLAPPGERHQGSWVGAAASLAADARLDPPSVLGAGVRLEAGARVGPLAVVGERSRIGAGARVERAVLWERVEVGAGARLRDCVVGADVRIGAHAEIGAEVVLESGAVIPERTRLPR